MIILGNKYIIEVEEVYHGEDHPNSLELYRVKGFNTLVFDHYGLNKLERLDEHDDALITKLAKNYYTKDDFDRESKDAYERGYADCLAENDFDKPCASCPDSRKHGEWLQDVYTAGGVLELLVNKCSACGGITPVDVRRYKYCPSCGARMFE